MKETITPYKNFDLPVINLPEEGHYIPPLTRDVTEAERRHSLPSGTVLLEQQRDGLRIAQDIISYPFDNPADRDFAYKETAHSLLNSSWYTYARSAPDVMRRRLDLAVLADDDAEWRETKSGLLTKTQSGLVRAVELAEALTNAHSCNRRTDRLSQQLGRQVGNVAINLACLPLADAPRGMSAYDIQYVARLTALDTLEQSRAPRGDTYASTAQLIDPDSPLSTSWRKNAPSTNQADNALVQAQEEYRGAA